MRNRSDTPGVDAKNVASAEVTRREGSLRVLLVDDERNLLQAFSMCLNDAGHSVATAGTSAAALDALNGGTFDLCLLDLNIGAESGLDLLPVLVEQAPWMRVVMLTAQSRLDYALSALERGASDYIVKPISPAQLQFLAAKTAAQKKLEARLEALEARAGGTPSVQATSDSAPMAAVLSEAMRVADTDASVLLLGESGTGKGVMAQAIHDASHRRDGALVTINCPSLSADLLESELFGHARGAFTGAAMSTQGRVAQADGGTLFLDELGDFPLALQPKLLRFLQDKVYERVGDPVTRRADVRIIAATNQDLDAMVADGRFRQDLLYRLNVITLTIPPLRARGEDVLRLALDAVEEFSAAYGRPARGFTDAARRALVDYQWPGNVRELRNVIERAVILSGDNRIDVAQLAIADTDGQAAGSGIVGSKLTLAELERAQIEAVLAREPTLDQAAATLGIDPSTLYRKRKLYDL